MALLKALEEEERVKKALHDAMASRDLESIKKALKVAMEMKSGAMMEGALAQAMGAGLADDPIIKQALEMEKHLDHEVSKGKMDEELIAALGTDNHDTMQSMVKMALEKGMADALGVDRFYTGGATCGKNVRTCKTSCSAKVNLRNRV